MNFKAIIGMLAVFVVLPLLITWVIYRIFRRRPSSDQRDESSRRFEERMLNPDFAALEAHFSCAIPKEFKELYANKEELRRGDFELRTRNPNGSEHTWTVAFYQPADLESLRDVRSDCIELFAFANDGCGNVYLIDLREPDLQVLFHDHEDGEFTKVGLSLAEFVAAARKTSSD